MTCNRRRPHVITQWFGFRNQQKRVDSLVLSTFVQAEGFVCKGWRSRPIMQVFKLDELNKLPDQTDHNNFSLSGVLYHYAKSQSTSFTGIVEITPILYSVTNFVMKRLMDQ